MPDSAKQTQKIAPHQGPGCGHCAWHRAGSAQEPGWFPPHHLPPSQQTNHPSAPPNPTTGVNSPKEEEKRGRSSATAWGRQCNGESQSPGIVFQTQDSIWPAQSSKHLPEPQGQSPALGFQVPCAAQFLTPSHKKAGLGGQVTDRNLGLIHWTLLGVGEGTGRGWSTEQSHPSPFPFLQQQVGCFPEPQCWDTLGRTPSSHWEAGSKSISSFQTPLSNQALA